MTNEQKIELCKQIIDNLDNYEIGHVYGLGVSGFLGSTIEIESTVFPAKKCQNT